MRARLLLTVFALMVGTIVATSGVPSQDDSTRGKQKKTDRAEFESQFPVTDVDKPAPSAPNKQARWKAKSKKYKGIGLSINERSELVTINNEWDIGLPALPVSKSDLVVVGDVVGAQAYLSEYKDWVYSEFNIRVEEVLKNASSITLTQGSALEADRDGGGVRFPSGRMAIQHIAGQGMPRVGRRYILFLTCEDEEQSIRILTGYELRGGRVFPLDHLVGASYKEADETSFLSYVRAAIANAQ